MFWVAYSRRSYWQDMDGGTGTKGKVVGVVKDFNFTSLHERIKPLIIHIYPLIIVRWDPG